MSDTSTARTAIDRLLHDAWTRTTGDLRREIEALWAAADAERTAAVDAARLEMARQIELARSGFAADAAARQAWTDSEMQKARAEIESAARARAQADADRDEARRRLDEVTRELMGARTDLEAAHAVAATAAGRAAEVEADAGARLALADLVRATRDLQQARTLGDVLDGLLRAARRVVAKVTLYIVRGDCLQEWTMTGGADVSTPVTRMWPAESPLWFEDDRGTFPIRVGGAVVAVLSVESAAADGDAHPVWVSAVDLLTRHASLVLESLTLRRNAKRDRRTDVHPPAAGDVPPASGDPV